MLSLSPQNKHPSDLSTCFITSILISTCAYKTRLYIYYIRRYRHRRDFNFENFGVALLTLFQVLTTEGWLQVRDMFGTEPFGSRKSQSWVSEVISSVCVCVCVGGGGGGEGIGFGLGPL